MAAFLAGAAHADNMSVVQPSACGMTFNVHVESFLLFSRGTGVGVVECHDAFNQVSSMANVDISVEGLGLGLGIFDYNGVVGNLGILNPAQIEGTYGVADVNVAVVGGLGAAVGFEGQKNGLSFTASLAGGKGLGVSVNGQTWTITLQH